MFQEELCLTILKGIHKQLIVDKRTRPGEHSVYAAMLDGDDEIEAFEKSQTAQEPTSFQQITRPKPIPGPRQM